MKKKDIIICFVICMAWLLPSKTLATTPDGGMQLKARVGYSLGGTAPIGIPATIRSIDAFRLAPSLMAGADLQLPFATNGECWRDCTSRTRPWTWM